MSKSKTCFRCTEMTETFEFGSVIRVYHVYQHIWDAEIGDIVTCQREEKNDFDRYAVALLSADTTSRVNILWSQFVEEVF